MSISQFFVLSPRGDSIIFRDWRHDLSRNSSEIFFRNSKFYNGQQVEAPPIFQLDNVNYIYLKKNGLYFVLTSRDNISPNLSIETLTRLTKLFKDYCGTLSEESIRTNFTLIYEVLDEVIDFGYVQGTNSEQVKSFVFNEPIVVKSSSLSPKGGMKFPDINTKTTPSTSVDKPISMKDKKGQKKNEIFVDIYERMTVALSPNGTSLNSSIDGTIQMKSYLAGNPELKLALNEDLVVLANSTSSAPTRRHYGSGGVVTLDDCNFHECVKSHDFDANKILSFIPPDGEFVLMNYRVTGDNLPIPFKIEPIFTLQSQYKAELIIQLRLDVPAQNSAANVLVTIPMPKSVSGVSCQLQDGAVGQAAEYEQSESSRKVIWRIKKFTGQATQMISTRITFSSPVTTAIRREIGPIALNFEIPMYNPSGLAVRYLRIMEDKSYNPFRWVRYVTRAQSYVCSLR